MLPRGDRPAGPRLVDAEPQNVDLTDRPRQVSEGVMLLSGTGQSYNFGWVGFGSVFNFIPKALMMVTFCILPSLKTSFHQIHIISLCDGFLKVASAQAGIQYVQAEQNKHNLRKVTTQ